jgi:hypothetical protein
MAMSVNPRYRTLQSGASGIERSHKCPKDVMNFGTIKIHDREKERIAV